MIYDIRLYMIFPIFHIVIWIYRFAMNKEVSLLISNCQNSDLFETSNNLFETFMRKTFSSKSFQAYYLDK